MAIDGRDIGKKTREPDAYDSLGVRIVAAALVWGPLALIVWLAYVTGSWLGGPWAGVASVGSTLATAAGIWIYRRFFKRHRSA